jgi:hypothetical protein
VLIPTAAPEEDRFSLTTDENPVLWVYVYPSDDPTTELSLRLYGTDPQTQELLFVRQTFEMPTEAGLMAMPLLPDGDEPLLLDTPYEWALFIQSEDDLASIPLSSGWVERTAVADDLMTQIETAEGLDAIALYAEAGLWHNTIDELIELRQTSDDPAITQAWNDVLSDAGLEAIAIDPILPCCLPTPTPESDP